MAQSEDRSEKEYLAQKLLVALRECQRQRDEIATQATQLSALQAENAAQATQLAAQKAEFDVAQAFVEDVRNLFGTSEQTDVLAFLMRKLGRNPDLASVIGVPDKVILLSLLDGCMDTRLEYLFPWYEDEDEDEAGKEARQHEANTKFHRMVCASVESMVEQNPHAPAFGTTAQILAKILRENCESPDPDFFHIAYSRVTRDPEWETLFQVWDDENSANQAQPISAGKAASQAQPISAGKQVKPCRDWVATGSCPRGDRCWFAH